MSATDHTSDLTSENWRMNAYYKPTMSSRESEPVLNAMRDVEFSDRGAAERRALADRLTATQGDAHELTAYTGQQGKGAATTRRAKMRAEAEQRNPSRCNIRKGAKV